MEVRKDVDGGEKDGKEMLQGVGSVSRGQGNIMRRGRESTKV